MRHLFMELEQAGVVFVPAVVHMQMYLDSQGSYCRGRQEVCWGAALASAWLQASAAPLSHVGVLTSRMQEG